MPMSHYPGGFAAGVSIRGVPIMVTHPGNVYWVDSGAGSNGNKGTVDRPFGTIDYAIGRCTASNGDIIFVKPGHTETISAAGGITADVAGVAIIGLGKGSLRPTVTLDTAVTATFLVSAADVTVHNMLFSVNFADVVRVFDVTAAGAHIDSCEFVAAATNMNWVDVIGVSGADDTGDALTVTGCRAFGVDAANNGFMLIANDIARMVVEDNFVVHDHANATAFITHTTGGIMLNAMIRNNVYCSLLTAVDVIVNNDVTTNTGAAIGNLASHADTASEVLVDADGLGLFDNKGSGVITASGYLLPAVDS
ncbi:MAG: hypothetical protein GY947_06505 [Rhodobacteraceae bacterium]|nr:hypothetical protein [Paracoccaceae bacterium]